MPDNPRWRASLRGMFSSKDVTELKTNKKSSKARSAASRGPSISSSDESADSGVALRPYSHQPKQSSVNNRVSMVPHKVAHDSLPNPYQRSNTKGPVYFGHREVPTDYQIMLTQTEVATKIRSSAALNTRPVGLPRTARVMDQIMAEHHEKQARLYGKNVEYLQTSSARPGLMF